MLNLLTCPRGHFWESTELAGACPECGAPADSLPLLDLAPSEALPPPVVALEIPLVDEDGRPIVAGYELREDLGRSHFRVRRYRARQLGINRDVLLEVVIAKEDASQNAWNALRGESSALGKLGHPNILAIHDVGERDRQLFYNAVEFVDGPTLAEIVDAKPLPFPQIMRLIELLARALDDAHERGILHRNLRPCSVLLQPVRLPKDSLGGADSVGAVCQLHDRFYLPKLTGFGLARKAVEGEVIDSEVYDEQVGYLSPEQAWGRAKDLGPNTDVYGLGGLLYFLLAGQPPFRGPTYTDVIDGIQGGELVTPSVTRRVPADLEAICRRCLTRSPRRRYASAVAVADDLRRAQRGDAIEAKPQSGARRIGRWIGRHPGVFVMTLLMLVGLIAGGILYISAVDEAEMAKRGRRSDSDRLRRESEEVQRLRIQTARNRELQTVLNYKRVIDRAKHSLDRNENNFARLILDSVAEPMRAFEWHYLMARSRGTGQYAIDGFTEDLTAIAFGPEGGRILATVHPGPADGFQRRRGNLQLWNVPLKTRLHEVTDLQGTPYALAFSPNGKRLAVGGSNLNENGGLLYLFDRSEKLGNTPFPSNFGTRLASVGFSDRGERVIAGLDDGTFSVLSGSDGRLLVPRVDLGAIAFGRPRTTRLETLPEGDRMVAFEAGGSEAKVFTTQGGMIRSFPGEVIYAVAMGEPKEGSARSIWLAIARSDASITIHDLRSLGDEIKLADLGRAPTLLAFSPDGKRLAAGFPDGNVRVWAQAGPAWLEMLALEGTARAGLAFSSSGKALAAGEARKVTIWGVLEE